MDRLVHSDGQGYVPDLNCVLLMGGGDGARAAALASHAEKKALGALLLRCGGQAAGEGGGTARGGLAPVRVRVNIRMCRDCHGAFCAAAAEFGRPLVCEDGSVTHRFDASGACSCGGRWR